MGGSGLGLSDVLHEEGEQVRRLREVKVVAEDDWSFSFQRIDGSVIRIGKRSIIRIEPAMPRGGGR